MPDVTELRELVVDGSQPVELTVYSRYGCHLCEDMLELLHDFQSELAYSVRVIDIDDDPALVELYNDAVPVLTLRGEEICRHFLDLEALQKVVDPEQRVS